MKLLADMGVSMTTVRALRQQGHDVVHLREQGLERATDAAILAKGAAEGRVVLTFDLDFGELLAAAGGSVPSVIIFRLADQTSGSVTPRLALVLAKCAGELAAGAVVVVEEGRYRLRRLPFK